MSSSEVSYKFRSVSTCLSLLAGERGGLISLSASAGGKSSKSSCWRIRGGVAGLDTVEDVMFVFTLTQGPVTASA